MKTSNPNGYLNVISHYQEHMQAVIEQQQSMPAKSDTAHPGVA
jgi:hypothetical protein